MATGEALDWPQSLLKVDMCLIYNEQQNMIWLQERSGLATVSAQGRHVFDL